MISVKTFLRLLKRDSKPKQCDIHVVVDSACICEENAKGKKISGWCRKHHTDWM